ncbi:hypothetical protein KHC28_00500 [Ancylobacter sonchi]|uniref:hypothetical protein n=1 Tax=Ancylobacter sonchi TaxID=1937790 RepID=UPI001BD54F98|nr:hypothetical protein [Ancylobacter sonchi]MBS7532145.1 hypothetical protein [Ancylobacter sonchi]
MAESAQFDDLDPKVREFLADLDEEKVAELEEAIRFTRATKTVSKFLKWCVITVVAMFITTAALGEAIQKIWGWFISIGGPK